MMDIASRAPPVSTTTSVGWQRQRTSHRLMVPVGIVADSADGRRGSSRCIHTKLPPSDRSKDIEAVQQGSTFAGRPPWLEGCNLAF